MNDKLQVKRVWQSPLLIDLSGIRFTAGGQFTQFVEQFDEPGTVTVHFSNTVSVPTTLAHGQPSTS